MKDKLLDYLVKHNMMSAGDAAEVVKKCVGGKTSREVVLADGLVAEERVIEALSRIYQVPLANLTEAKFPDEILHVIDPNQLRATVCMPFTRSDFNEPGIMLVAVNDPLNLRARDVVAVTLRCQVRVQLATSTDILLAIDRHFGRVEYAEAAKAYETAETPQETGSAAQREEINSSPVVKLVNSLVDQAVRQRASDIHIEPNSDRVRVRFRIDGLLYDQTPYDVKMLAGIITRVKVLGGMYISEKRIPQDGQFSRVVDNTEYDIRVSTLPTVYGEKCVLRLQRKESLKRDKRELGMSREEMEKFDSILSRPYGIVLVTGPTGSGKSTTLYTALSGLNRESVNIVTVEDPVEANIAGINQVQVNPKADLTFATALRSILRQDPDIIMIGEIRDTETAQIAIQASITGHLVCSTLHTNDTASSITRLLDMGVESYLIADATTGIIAQRLVRRLCPRCKRERPLEPGEAEYMGLAEDAGHVVYDAVGCPYCGHTGYFGRIGVYEIMEITPRLRGLIAARASTDIIRDAAIEEGMHPLKESARSLVLSGVTTVTEMARISDGDADAPETGTSDNKREK